MNIVRMGNNKFALSDKEWSEVKALLEKYSRFRTYTVMAAKKDDAEQVIRAIIKAMRGEIGAIQITGPDDPECKIKFERIIDPDPIIEKAFDLLYYTLATSPYVKNCDPPPRPPL